MTMSGSNHTVPSAPLDLTNKTRERVSCSQRSTDEKQVESAHRCINGQAINPRDTFNGSTSPSDDAKVMVQTRSITPQMKCDKSTDTAGKLADHSFSKLPIRKRPFPVDPSSESEPQNKLKDERCAPVSKAHRNESHSDRDARRTANDHERNSPFLQAFPACFFAGCPYNQWPHQHTGGPSLSSPPPVESSERPLADIAAATHQDEDGDTPLHIAVVKENGELVWWLIEIFRRAHRDLDIFNNLRQTPLHLAVITHQLNLVKALLDAGADPGALDRHGQTALHLCCEHGEANCLDVILRHYLHNPSPHLEIRNYEGLTPLHLAVQNRDKKLAKILLDRGAEINSGDNKSGRSPLMHAVENDCIDMVSLLIESRCDVNAQSYSGNTALHSACGRGRIEIVRLLLKNGADSSLKNNHNDTAIMVANNKKVSDVLRGKGSVKALSSNNGSLSPGSSNHSPQLTPTHKSSTSLSPVPSVSHLPRSQSVENISGRQSPVNGNENTRMPMLPRSLRNITADNEATYGMQLHPFLWFSPSFPHIHRRTLIAGPCYDIHNPLYYTNAHIIGIPVPVSPSQGTVNQSRPSSHSSDQSDMSTMSINSEERAAS
ncbi:B-cell lymphoma 3 protein [Triplophysa dalaica]|uniref:B-cell lymphoma 3 protein n=1 Tax=Triplophysa dalaica TaxID=1582913 RepID=UPI0024DF7C5F|nr:B-cell lymphoma 3 protein [Triplophysa dalaica]